MWFGDVEWIGYGYKIIIRGNEGLNKIYIFII